LTLIGEAKVDVLVWKSINEVTSVLGVAGEECSPFGQDWLSSIRKGAESTYRGILSRSRDFERVPGKVHINPDGVTPLL